MIKVGVLSYLVPNESVNIDVTIDESVSGESESQQHSDPWNFWVFEVYGSIDWQQEANRKEYEWNVGIDVERTTDAWRIRGDFETESRINQVKRNNDELTTERKYSELEASAVKSLTDHWSLGAFGSLYSSTYTNIRTGSRLQAAIEYNVFPYRLSTTKEFTIAYLIGPRNFSYQEETIYGKTKEQLVGQGIRVNLDLNQPWGRAEIQTGRYALSSGYEEK